MVVLAMAVVLFIDVAEKVDFRTTTLLVYATFAVSLAAGGLAAGCGRG